MRPSSARASSPSTSSSSSSFSTFSAEEKHQHHLEPLYDNDKEYGFSSNSDSDSMDHELPARFPSSYSFRIPRRRRLLRRLCGRVKWLRRTLLTFVLAIIAARWIWKARLEPWIEEDRFLRPGLDMKFGFGMQSPQMMDTVTHLQFLDPSHMPGGPADPQGIKRLVFVGDIHGCLEELDALLKVIGLNLQHDHIVHTGDVIAKGPDSTGVIDRLITYNATGVRGNWEDRTLAAHHSTVIRGALDQLANVSASRFDDRAPQEIPVQPFPESTVHLELKPRHVAYLQSLPLVISIPPITPRSRFASLSNSFTPSTNTLPADAAFLDDKARIDDILASKQNTRLGPHHINIPTYVVHAGIVPAVPLSRQDPASLMTMRFIHSRTHLPTARYVADSVPWARVWGWYQSRLERGIAKPAIADPLARHGGYISDRTGKRQWRHEFPPDPSAGEQWLWWAGEVLGAMGMGRWAPRVEDRAAPYLANETALVLPENEVPTAVVYGHDSKEGVRLERYSMGIDGGCVGGGRLTAVTLDAFGKREVWSVRCRNYLLQ